MDPLMQQLIKDVATLQAQIEWLTWLVRMSLALSGVSSLLGAVSVAVNMKNNKRKS